MVMNMVCKTTLVTFLDDGKNDIGISRISAATTRGSDAGLNSTGTINTKGKHDTNVKL